jgi:chemotaxis protein MotB
MITLLMAFFIMMYSMSVLNISKFNEAAVSIRSGFGGMLKGQGTSVFGRNSAINPKAVADDKENIAGVSWRVLEPLVNYIQKNKKNSDDLSIGVDKRGIVITLSSDTLLFEPNSSDIKPQAYPVLEEVVNVLKKVNNTVQIEGHTCSLSPRGSRYPTNWELSTARSTCILRYLTEKKSLDPSRFYAAGYGSCRPIASNRTEEGRRKNRRVEIVILRPDAS